MSSDKIEYLYYSDTHPIANVPQTDEFKSGSVTVWSVSIEQNAGTSFGDFFPSGGGLAMARIEQAIQRIVQMRDLGCTREIPDQRTERLSMYYIRSEPKARIYWELLKSSSGEYRGYRMHIHTRDPEFNLGDGVEKLITENMIEKDRAKRFTRGQPPNPKKHEFWKTLESKTQWATWLDIYTQGTLRLSSGANKDRVNDTMVMLGKWQNPAHPCKVLSLGNSMSFNVKDVQPAQTLLANYFTYSQNVAVFKFPFPELVWEMDISKFDPYVLHKIKFPGCIEILASQMKVNVPSKQAVREFVRRTEYTVEISDPNITEQDVFKMYMEQMEKENREREKKMTEDDEEARTYELLKKLEDWAQVVDSSFLGSMKYDDIDLSKRDPLYAMKNANEKKVQLIKNLYREGSEDYISQMTAFKKEALRELVTYLESGDERRYRVLKLVIQHINTLKQESPRHNLCRDHYMATKNLTPYGDWKAKRMKQYDKNLGFYTVQRLFMISWNSRLDAFRLQKNLHINPLLCGGADASKSAILKQLEALSVKNTVTPTTYMSEKTFATGESYNMECYLFHEAPLKDMGMNKDGKKQAADPCAKNMATEGEFVTMVFEYDENKKIRTFKVYKADCMMNTFKCSNEVLANISKETQERNEVHLCVKEERPDCKRSIYVNSTKRDRDPVKVEETLEDHRTEMCFQAIIELFIFVGIFEDVSMEAAEKIVMEVLNGVTEKTGLSTEHTRKVHQLKMHIRNEAIQFAQETVLHSEISRFKNKQFEYQDLLHLEPFLVATEEMAWFWLTARQDAFLPVMDGQILKPIMERFCAYPQASHEKTAEMITAKSNWCPAEKYKRINQNREIDHRYLVIQKSLNAIAAEAATVLKDGMLSYPVIFSVLTGLEGRFIKSRIRNQKGDVIYNKVYSKDKNGNKIRVADAQKNGNDPFEFRPVATYESIKCLERYVFNQQEWTYIAVDALLEDFGEVMKDCIREKSFYAEIWDRTNPVTKVKKDIVLGLPAKWKGGKYQQVLDTMKVEPNPSLHLLHSQVFHLDRTEEALLYNNNYTPTEYQLDKSKRFPIVAFNISLDEYFARTRILTIGYDYNTLNGLCLNSIPKMLEGAIAFTRAKFHEGFFSTFVTLDNWPEEVIQEAANTKHLLNMAKQAIHATGTIPKAITKLTDLEEKGNFWFRVDSVDTYEFKQLRPNASASEISNAVEAINTAYNISNPITHNEEARAVAIRQRKGLRVTKRARIQEWEEEEAGDKEIDAEDDSEFYTSMVDGNGKRKKKAEEDDPLPPGLIRYTDSLGEMRGKIERDRETISSYHTLQSLNSEVSMRNVPAPMSKDEVEEIADMLESAMTKANQMVCDSDSGPSPDMRDELRHSTDSDQEESLSRYLTNRVSSGKSKAYWKAKASLFTKKHVPSPSPSDMGIAHYYGDMLNRVINEDSNAGHSS